MFVSTPESKRMRPTLSLKCSSLRFLPFLLVAGLGLTGCGESPQPEQAADSDRGAELSKRFLLVDTHIDVPYRIHDEYEDVSVGTDGGDFDYPRAVAGGLDSMFMSIYIPADVDTAGEAKGFAEGLIDSMEALAASAPDKFAIATCTADVLALKDAGIISLPMGMENGGPIEGSFENLEHFANRGIRYITLAHSKSNHISDSSYDLNEQWQGLSEFGKTLIPEMNRQGVMIDVSHISDRAFWQVLELTEVPVIASHSSMRHYTPGFQRNMNDEMVAALRENGGVIQINFGSSFLTKAARDYGNGAQQAMIRFRAESPENQSDEKMAEFARNYRIENPYPYATVEDVLDHIDRAVELAGIDHVGIGSDYDGVGDSLPNGLKDVSEYPNLVNGLLERGYSEADIEKIWGGNTMRVWAEAEAYAAAAGNPPQCRV